MQIIPTHKLNLNCCSNAGKAVMNKGCTLLNISMHGLWICFTHIKEKYSYLESALVNSSQNCRTAKKEIIQWKSRSSGLLWALPNLIFTWHVTLQVPGLMFSHLCLVQGRDSAPGRLRSEITLSLSLLLPLGICKVNSCSSHFFPTFPAFPFFLFKWN